MPLPTRWRLEPGARGRWLSTVAARCRRLAARSLDHLDVQRRRLARAAARPAVERSLGGLLAAAGGLLVLLVGAFGVIAREVGPIARGFASHAAAMPSRLLSEPLELSAGATLDAELVVRYLNDLGFAAAARPAALRPGQYCLERQESDEGSGGGSTEGEARARQVSPSGGVTLSLWTRPFTNGWVKTGPLVVVPNRRIELAFSARGLDEIVVDGERAESALLEPVELVAYYGPQLRDRRPVTLEQVPPHVVRAVLAAEDAGFFDHGGVSLAGTVRAAWVNFRRGGIAQGGSTLTQQLVRSLYLDSSRTFHRKGREAVLATLIEQRHPKRAILEAYLNETYWGLRDGVSVVGLGAAARTWFGKDPSDLDLAEAALLAGMIQSPGRYLPNERPRAALARRDWVLGRLLELGWIAPAEHAAATRSALLLGSGRPPRRARFFADAIAEEARQRFGIDQLAEAGVTLYSTLRWRDQVAAEAALGDGLAELEGKKRQSPASPALEGSLLSVDPRTGAVLAYVGGRDYSRSQFDRVRSARRQIGSLFKPVVYAAAFGGAHVAPNDLLSDEPLEVHYDEEVWSPRNSLGQYHGTVTVRRALEASLNAATVRLAVHTGLEAIERQALELGLPLDDEVGPAMVLGASSATSWQVASAYAALANGGRRVPLHGLARVVDRHGEVLERPLEAHEAMSERTAFLVTSLLQGVVARGTASSVRSLGLEDPVAGKTGTSNQGRDGWFAGYSSDRATVVWVGYDDNLPTRLSGTRGALPLWTRFSLAVRPPGGYGQVSPPDGVAAAWVDPASGGLATASCPSRIREYLPAGAGLAASCALHSEHQAGTVVTAALEADSRDPGWTTGGRPTSFDASSHIANTQAGEASPLARVAVASSLEAIGFRSRNARLALAAAGAPNHGWSGTSRTVSASPAPLAAPGSVIRIPATSRGEEVAPGSREVFVLDGPRGRRVEVLPPAGDAPQHQ